MCVIKSPNVYDNCIPCSICHPTVSCMGMSAISIIKLFKSCWKAFLIAHLIPVVLYKRKQFIKDPKAV